MNRPALVFALVAVVIAASVTTVVLTRYRGVPTSA